MLEAHDGTFGTNANFGGPSKMPGAGTPYATRQVMGAHGASTPGAYTPIDESSDGRAGPRAAKPRATVMDRENGTPRLGAALERRALEHYWGGGAGTPGAGTPYGEVFQLFGKLDRMIITGQHCQIAGQHC